MANIFIETWHETIEDVKKIMPENIKEQLARNKYKYIGVVLLLLVLELGLARVIWDFFTDKTQETNITKISETVKGGK